MQSFRLLALFLLSPKLLIGIIVYLSLMLALVLIKKDNSFGNFTWG